MKASKDFPRIVTRREIEKRKLHHKRRAKHHTLIKKGRYRLKTFAKQNGICHYCKRRKDFSEWTVDHVIPVSRGGTSEPSNLVGACASCNFKKGNQSIITP